MTDKLILEELKEKANITDSELREKLDIIKKKYENLLNDEGAAIILAKELGVEIKEKEKPIIMLKDLDENQKNISVLVTVREIYPKKEFKSQKGDGFFYNLAVFDKTGNSVLTVWNKEVNLKPGDVIFVDNVYVNKFRDQFKLNLSKGDITVRGFEPIVVNTKKIADLNIGEIVNVEGVIIDKKPLKEFESKTGNRGFLLRFFLYDNKRKISVVAWNDLAKKLDKEDENTKIMLKNVLIKKNNVFKEISVSDKSDFEVLEKNVKVDLEVPNKKISELAYDELSKIEGTILDLERIYNKEVCKKCGTIMELKEGRFFCPKCDDFTDVRKKVVAVFKVGDDSAQTNAVFFTKQAMKLVDANDSNFDDKFGSFDYKGKKLTLIGTLKKTEYEDFIVNKLL